MTEPDHADLLARVEQLRARGETAPRSALDAVDVAMIRHWVEAIGDTDPRWQGADAVAPPAMAQVWTMYGLDPHRPADDPLHGTMQLLDEAGYTSVLGTNCDQTYARPLRPGERPAITTRLESVVGPKHTGVGEGWFVTTLSRWWVDDEPVATMRFRVLKYAPGTGRPTVDRSRIVRPTIGLDNAFFFEGARAGELRIQSCGACGALRHPPGPMCPSCHSSDRTYVVASGRGRVHSGLVHHAPAVPGRALPLPLVLVDLEEGVRMVGTIDLPEGVDAPEIGAEVELSWDRIDDQLTLPAWRPAGSEPLHEAARLDESAHPHAGDAATRLPEWELPVTARLVVSAAIATRDFQDVHHDRDAAIARGSKDIFLNILTTTGLVQSYVGDWARGQGMGPTRVTACELRLGAPAYPGDTLVFDGEVADGEPGTITVDVVGRVSLGDHVTARVSFVEESA